jgi:DNA-binding NarL/FixJ family response regulator
MQSLIVARSGAIQEALTTILSSIPQINIIGVAENSLIALGMMQTHHPELVIVDDNFAEGETVNFIRHLGRDWPQTKIVVLADRFQQKQSLIDCGADAVLLRGIPTEQITETIDCIRLGKTINQNSCIRGKNND